MTKTKRIVLIVVAILVALLVAAGVVTGLVLTGHFAPFAAWYEDDWQYFAGATTLDATQVREIEINWLDGSVTVETHTGEGIVLEETGAGAEEEDQLHWRLEEGELTIQYRASRFLTMSGDDKQLRVLVPEGLALNEISIETVSAAVDVTDVQAQELSLDTVSGDSVLAGGVEQVSVETTTGHCVLQGSAALRQVEGSSLTGGFTVAMGEATGVTAYLESLLGDLDSELTGATGNQDRLTWGDGQTRMMFETITGDVTFTG